MKKKNFFRRRKKVSNRSQIKKKNCLVGLNFFSFFEFWVDFLFWFDNLNDIGISCFGSVDAVFVVWFQDFDFDTEHSLTEENVSDGFVDILFSWITGVDHHSVDEFHTFCTLTTDFTGDHDFTTTTARFLDKSEDAISGTSDW